jgi:hypothetical protein
VAGRIEGVTAERAGRPSGRDKLFTPFDQGGGLLPGDDEAAAGGAAVVLVHGFLGDEHDPIGVVVVAQLHGADGPVRFDRLLQATCCFSSLRFSTRAPSLA